MIPVLAAYRDPRCSGLSRRTLDGQCRHRHRAPICGRRWANWADDPHLRARRSWRTRRTNRRHRARQAKAIRETACSPASAPPICSPRWRRPCGVSALDLVKKNNVELVKGVDRASTTVAATHGRDGARALTNQRLVPADHCPHHHRPDDRPHRRIAETRPARSTSRRPRRPSRSRRCSALLRISTTRWTRSTG